MRPEGSAVLENGPRGRPLASGHGRMLAVCRPQTGAGSLVRVLSIKGLGEVDLLRVAAAINHATGKRVCDMPITIDKLL